MGAVISPSADPMLVMEFMEYGSLYDILRNETMYAGGEIILQVVRDITQGIQFLHASKPPILHGDLKARNILVDSRFRAKVADFGFSTLKGTNAKASKTSVLKGTPFFMAPEYLRRKTGYTTQCDIYSLGMIFFEVYAKQNPFEGEDPRLLLPKICHPRINKRPTMPVAAPPKMVDIIKKCWNANPVRGYEVSVQRRLVIRVISVVPCCSLLFLTLRNSTEQFSRPTAKDIDYALVEMSSKEAEPLRIVHNEFKDCMERKPTSLYDVFPRHIADALNAGKSVDPESHEMVVSRLSVIYH
jgi:serine/threonine protein kinase